MHRTVYGPSPADHFRNPRGLAVDAEHGVIAVGDAGGHRVAFFDPDGRYRGALSWNRDVWGELQRQPRSVSIDPRGRLFVLDSTGREIEVLSPTGARLGRFQPPLHADFGDASSAAVHVGASGRIYTLLTGDRAGVAVIEPDARSARVIEFARVAPEAFASPTAFAVDPDESRIAIVDQRATLQMKVISMGGALLYEFGPHTEDREGFSLAYSATWGPEGTLWVVDTMRHSISIFDPEGSYLGRIGGFGRGPGQLNYPAACAFLSDQRLVVLERAGSRFQVLELETRFLESSHTSLEMLGSETRGQYFSLLEEGGDSR